MNNEPKQEDLDEHLFHVAETHNFSSQDETCPTQHGECPHCREEAYAPRGKPGFALIGTLFIGGFAVMSLGHGSIGGMVAITGIVWLFALEDYPEHIHSALSRVGL